MGICSSCEVNTGVATAKLIMHDGRLQEFSYPVKASFLMQKDPTCFICNSDEMEFNDVLSAINADEELQPGQLYFAIPLSRLQRPIQAEEMAALAVKANSAFIKSGCCRKMVSNMKVVENGGGRAASELGSRRGRSGRDRRGRFTAILTAIPE
ncbi:uncharacterized protein LOC124916635 [Impatiens glandulifera]|uniref:uncharacterized protein LOC124916635 n=1 Tax=Impatiens glandulifera TaxID=253017 RepID=UPI001FB05603|nr:uncharacterized protein LOC124916635 [Impatiens glandulifera]